MSKRHHGITIASLFVAVAACSSDESSGVNPPESRAVLDLRVGAEQVVNELAVFPALGARISKTIVLAKHPEGFRSPFTGTLTATIPADAGGAMHIGLRERSDIWIEVVADDLAPIGGVAAGSAVVFTAAARDMDVAHLIDPTHVEEIRVLRSSAAATTASYSIRISHGLRTVRVREGRIEAVDANGYVHLGTSRLFAVDAKGERRNLEARVWGSGDRYRITTTFDGSGLVLPIAVDPSWSSTPTMSQMRMQHAAALISGGKVLVTGGQASVGDPRTTAEIYDPSTNTWKDAANLTVGRLAHISTSLPGGKALVACGFNVTGSLTSAEIFDPSTGSWSTATSAKAVGGGCVATVLSSGKILVTGGSTGSGSTYTLISAAEVYDPATNTWTDTSGFTGPRTYHASTLLSSGKVLVSGGTSMTGWYSDAQLYDPTTNKWFAASPMNAMRYGHSSVLLPSGKVVIAGGGESADATTAEIYDPSLDKWTVITAGLKKPRYYLQSAFAGAKAVFIGGFGNIGGGSSGGTKEVELFDPTTSTFSDGPSMIYGRAYHAATMLTSGKLLVAGGYTSSSSGTLSSAEIYNPAASCVLDTDCATTEYCASTLCAPRLATGLPCIAPTNCISGNCADSVCCDKPCAGNCDACSAVTKGSGADGTCGFAAVGTDPHSKCPLDSGFPASCKADGYCDGAGACRAFALTGTACGTTSCSAGKVSGKTCNGSGSCLSGTGTPCDPYVCDSTATSCLTKCSTDADCMSGYACFGTVCSTKLGIGKACTSSGQCTGGNCVDGVCCDTPCTGDCQACTATLKGGSGADGTCGNAAAETNPRTRCKIDAGYPASCKSDGLCDGKGACRAFAKPSTACGTTTCVAGKVSGKLCDGAGTCASGTGTPCDPYVCDSAGAACLTKCVGDSDCITGYRCIGGACIPRVLKKNGQTCADPTECSSGFCADTYCCDTACKGQCSACDLKGTEGTCTAVLGPPPGSRAPCGDLADPCSGRCNGVDKDKCSFGSAGTMCGATCSDGMLTSSTCDGKGGCAPTAPVPCNGFICEDKSNCKKTCTSDGDCVAPNVCVEGACTPPGGDDAVQTKSGCGCHVPAKDERTLPAGALLLLALVLRSRRRLRN